MLFSLTCKLSIEGRFACSVEEENLANRLKTLKCIFSKPNSYAYTAVLFCMILNQFVEFKNVSFKTFAQQMLMFDGILCCWLFSFFVQIIPIEAYFCFVFTCCVALRLFIKITFTSPIYCCFHLFFSFINHEIGK